MYSLSLKKTIAWFNLINVVSVLISLKYRDHPATLKKSLNTGSLKEIRPYQKYPSAAYPLQDEKLRQFL